MRTAYSNRAIFLMFRNTLHNLDKRFSKAVKHNDLTQFIIKWGR
jgi:hypothetical protein